MAIYGHKALELISIEENMYLESFGLDIMNEVSVEDIKEKIVTAIKKLKGFIEKILNRIKEILTSGVGNAIDTINGIANRIKSGVKMKSVNAAYIMEADDENDLEEKFNSIKQEIIDKCALWIGSLNYINEYMGGMDEIEKCFDIDAEKKFIDGIARGTELDQDWVNLIVQQYEQLDKLKEMAQQQKRELTEKGIEYIESTLGYNQSKGIYNFSELAQILQNIAPKMKQYYDQSLVIIQHNKDVISYMEKTMSSSKADIAKDNMKILTHVLKIRKADADIAAEDLPALQSMTNYIISIMSKIEKIVRGHVESNS